MKKWIMPLTIVLVIVTSIFAYAYEREQMGIGELTSDTIKNSAGTTVIDVKNGTSALTNTGHATLDLPLAGGTMTGPIRGKKPVSFGNMTGAGRQVFGTTTTIVLNNGKVQAGGYVFTIHTSTIGGRKRHVWSD